MKRVCSSVSIILLSVIVSGYSNNTNIVKMEGMRFSPKQLSIKAGETVRWVNESNGTHNVVENTKLFKSEMLTQRGDYFEYLFTKPGTYYYYCQPHRLMGMKGIIIVSQ